MGSFSAIGGRAGPLISHWLLDTSLPPQVPESPIPQASAPLSLASHCLTAPSALGASPAAAVHVRARPLRDAPPPPPPLPHPLPTPFHSAPLRTRPALYTLYSIRSPLRAWLQSIACRMGPREKGSAQFWLSLLPFPKMGLPGSSIRYFGSRRPSASFAS